MQWSKSQVFIIVLISALTTNGSPPTTKCICWAPSGQYSNYPFGFCGSDLMDMQDKNQKINKKNCKRNVRYSCDGYGTNATIAENCDLSLTVCRHRKKIVYKIPFDLGFEAACLPEKNEYDCFCPELFKSSQEGICGYVLERYQNQTVKKPNLHCLTNGLYYCHDRAGKLATLQEDCGAKPGNGTCQYYTPPQKMIKTSNVSSNYDDYTNDTHISHINEFSFCLKSVSVRFEASFPPVNIHQ